MGQQPAFTFRLTMLCNFMGLHWASHYRRAGVTGKIRENTLKAYSLFPFSSVCQQPNQACVSSGSARAFALHSTVDIVLGKYLSCIKPRVSGAGAECREFPFQHDPCYNAAYICFLSKEWLIELLLMTGEMHAKLS